VEEMLTDTIKEELIKGLCELLHENLSMIILYGSVARNEATPESDIDIAIITKKDMDEEIRNKFICWAAELDIRYDKVFSIIDIKEENMKKWGKVLPFYQNVQKEGVILWKAA
jgi:predicted nucleotidyltransferase